MKLTYLNIRRDSDLSRRTASASDTSKRSDVKVEIQTGIFMMKLSPSGDKGLQCIIISSRILPNALLTLLIEQPFPP